MLIYDVYSNRADMIFRFVSLYERYLNMNKSSQTTSVERYLLISINENQGITNSKLAAMFGRTPGAITQTLIKLEQKLLIERVKRRSNAKTVLLYPTPAGVNLAIDYKFQEINHMAKILHDLNLTYSQAEIDTFWNILSDFSDILSSFPFKS